MYKPPRNDVEYSRYRLDRILSRRRLCFNPYTVSDRELLERVMSVGWGNEYDIVQMVVMTFTRLRPVGDSRKFDGIFFRLGKEEKEGFIYSGALAYPVTANDTLQPARCLYGTLPLRHPEDLERLVGRRVFVSRLIRGVNIKRNNRVAYRMHPLRGTVASQAKIIREAMIASKIEMLERILSHPECNDYLSCSKGLFDYEIRLREMIEIIKRYPETRISTY